MNFAWKALLVLDILAALFLVGTGLGWLGARLWRRVRKQQQGWPATEQLQRRPPDSWQARHRRAYDRGKLKPVRGCSDGIGHARITRARIRHEK